MLSAGYYNMGNGTALFGLSVTIIKYSIVVGLSIVIRMRYIQSDYNSKVSGIYGVVKMVEFICDNHRLVKSIITIKMYRMSEIDITKNVDWPDTKKNHAKNIR